MAAPIPDRRRMVAWRVAEAAGVSAQYVQMLETGITNPSLDTIERFVIALGLSTRQAGVLRRVGNAHR